MKTRQELEEENENLKKMVETLKEQFDVAMETLQRLKFGK